MRKFIWILGILLVVSCARLDDIAFVNDNTIEAYLYDDWDEDPEFEMPEGKYDVADSMIHELSLTSQGPNDDKPYLIRAIYLGNLADVKTDSIIVYCHGQSLHMDAYWQRAKLLAHCGGLHRYGILEMDYRGFGLSEGNPTEEGMYEDVRTCLRWLKENGANNNRVFIYGYSLGTAPATEMAAYFDEFKPRKLILEAPFASAENLGQESTLINFDSKYMADLKFNNADKIKDVSQPFLLFHGEKDDYLKISNGEIIFKNYNGVYGDFVRVPEANHSGEMGIPPAMGLEEYINTIHEFLKR